MNSVRLYPLTYDRDDTDDHSNSDTDDHVMNSVRFYPRTYDSDDSDGHSVNDTDDHVMSNAKFYLCTHDSDDIDGHSNSSLWWTQSMICGLTNFNFIAGEDDSRLKSSEMSGWTRIQFNWFRCYHTWCDNRHRILSRWFQLDYWFFELANQTQRYINFEYRKINNHCFSLKSIHCILFFLTFWKQHYKINQLWNNPK